MLRDAALVAGKDLLLERRTRSAAGQIVPFALLVLVIFGFAVDADAAVLRRTAPGLLWVAVLLASLLAAGRQATVEVDDGLPDAIRLSGLPPTAWFLGKTGALVVQLVAVELVLAIGVVVMYDVTIDDPLLFAAVLVPATVTLAAVGTLYGAMSLGIRVRETLLPLLVLPAVAPVLLAATRAHERAMGLSTGSGWPWVGLLVVIAVVYGGAGLAAYGPLVEDA